MISFEPGLSINQNNCNFDDVTSQSLNLSNALGAREDAYLTLANVTESSKFQMSKGHVDPQTPLDSRTQIIVFQRTVWNLINNKLAAKYGLPK